MLESQVLLLVSEQQLMLTIVCTKRLCYSTDFQGKGYVVAIPPHGVFEIPVTSLNAEKVQITILTDCFRRTITMKRHKTHLKIIETKVIILEYQLVCHFTRKIDRAEKPQISIVNYRGCFYSSTRPFYTRPRLSSRECGVDFQYKYELPTRTIHTKEELWRALDAQKAVHKRLRTHSSPMKKKKRKKINPCLGLSDSAEIRFSAVRSPRFSVRNDSPNCFRQ